MNNLKNLTIITGIAIIVSILVFIWLDTFKQKHHYVYEDKIVLKTQAVKNELVEEVDKYIQSVAPNSALDGFLVVTTCEDYNIDICFVLAQGQKESHFGTKGLARKTNSVFNVYAYDGKGKDDIHPNGIYNTPNESVEPYLKLLKKNYLVDKSEYDLLCKYVNKHGKRYASAPDYELQLSNIYCNIKNNTKIDSLSLVYKRYKYILF